MRQLIDCPFTPDRTVLATTERLGTCCSMAPNLLPSGAGVMQVLEAGNFAPNIYAVPTFVTGLTALLLGLIVLLRERRSAVGIGFCLMAVPVSVWMIGQSGIYVSADPQTALVWQRITFFGVPFIPASIYHFSVLFLGLYPRRRLLVLISWALASLFSVLAVLGDGMFTHMRLYWWGYYPLYSGLAVPFFAFFFTVLIVCWRDYYLAYRREKPGKQRLRIRALLIGFAISYLSVVDFLPTAGIAFYPVGYLPVFIFLGIAARTIRRYRLLDFAPAFAARQIVNTMADSLVVCDAEGTIRVVNPAICRTLAYSADELLGEPITCLLPPGEQPAEQFDRLLRGPAVVDREMSFADKNGCTVDMSVSVSHLQDEQRTNVGCVLIAHDVRERKRSHARLREEADISAALARVAGELISALDQPLLLDRLCELTAEVLGSDASHTLLWQPVKKAFMPVASYGSTKEERKAARFVQISRDLMTDLFARFETEDVAVAGSVPDQELGLELRKGTLLPPYLCMALRRGEDLIGVQVAWWRSPPPPLSRRQRRVARGVSQLASLALENARLMEELNEANNIKSDFVATMSHELRTPLGVIIGYADLLIDGTVGDLTGEQANMLRRMRHNAFDLIELISSTLDLSRLQRGQIELSRERTTLVDLAGQVAEEAYAQQDKPRVTMECRIPADLPNVYTDAPKLKVILKNLLLNALKFTNEGSVMLTAATRDGGVECTITDTGVGIAPELLPVIFEPFRQLAAGRDRRHGGVGLGLYIVKRMVELLEGRLEVESKVGRGTTFRVWIPVWPSGAEGSPRLFPTEADSCLEQPLRVAH
jgi:PAS domain S-box-containing protein